LGDALAVVALNDGNSPPMEIARERLETRTLRRKSRGTDGGGETGTMGVQKKNRNSETNIPSAAFYLV
jgi:hypothetical protein